MEKPWLADYPMSLEKAKWLIDQQFPEIEIRDIQLLGEGFDNTVVQLNGEYVFRFPRRELAMKLMKVENQLLPLIVGRVPLEIPEPLFFGRPSESFPYSFTGYKMISGRTPYRESLEGKIASAQKLACFLKVLHDVPVTQAAKCGVTFDQRRRLDLPFQKVKLLENAKLVKRLGYAEQANLVFNYAASVQGMKQARHISFVHGDIHIRNVLLDHSGVLTGVIDWGDVHLGHPAVDLSFIYSYFPKQAREAFFDIYGEIDDETEKLARFRAIFMLVTLFIYAIDRHDKPLIELIAEGLRLAIED